MNHYATPTFFFSTKSLKCDTKLGFFSYLITSISFVCRLSISSGMPSGGACKFECTLF
jgi:hypothetical protein